MVLIITDRSYDMKKIAFLIQIVAVIVLLSSTAFAHDHHWDRHEHGWGHHHRGHHHHGHHHGWGGYPGRQVNNYYPQPQANYYYQQPPTYYEPRQQYYPPQPQYNYGGRYYDNRSHQGLAGGVVGNVFGYELGNGHPLAAGIGAAAGSFLGNGLGRNY
jgi:hypothetical protein